MKNSWKELWLNSFFSGFLTFGTTVCVPWSAKLACLSHLWGQQSWRTLTQKRTEMNRRDRTSVVCFCTNSPTELRQERNRCVRGRVGKGDRNSTVVWFHIFKNYWSLQISVFHFLSKFEKQNKKIAIYRVPALNEDNRNWKGKVFKVNN